MKTKFTKPVALAMALLMCIPLFACAAQKKPGGETEAAVSNTTGSEPVETTILDAVEKKDYGGYEFKYLAVRAGINNTSRFVDEMWVEGEVGEVINDAVYARNQFIFDKLNVEVAVVPSDNPRGDLKKSVDSGDNAYDMSGFYKGDALGAAIEGTVRNWNDLDIDYSQPWWSKSAVEKLSVCGVQFLMSGSILISEIDDTLAMVYNKGLAVDYNIGDIYSDVRNMEWTVEKFGSYITQISGDLNGDGKYKAGDDLFGYVQDPASMNNNWVFSCKLLSGYIDESGDYEMNVDTDRVQRTLDRLSPLLSSDSTALGVDLYEGLKYFEENKIFIYAIILRNLELLREMDLDFGVIPYPMLDEDQGEYITHVGSASPILVIPLTNTEDDVRLADILETMARASKYYVIPAYYDTALKVKVTRDEQSSEMLDIILASSSYDITYLIGAGLVSTIAPLLAKGKTDFASTWAKSETRTLATIQKTIDKLVEASQNY